MRLVLEERRKGRCRLNLYDKGINVIRSMNDEQLKRLLYKVCPGTLDIPCERCRNKYSCVDCWNRDEYKELTIKDYVLQELKSIPFYHQRICMFDEILEELESRFSLKSLDFTQPRTENKEDFISKLNRWINAKSKYEYYRNNYIDNLNNIIDLINVLDNEYRQSISSYIHTNAKDEYFNQAIKSLTIQYLKRKET